MPSDPSQDEFRRAIEPFRRELQAHCYRMLGSLQEAQDAAQESLLRAWSGYAGYQGRSSLRTWLYRIATHHCLNVRRSARRRPAKAWDVPHVEPPEPTRLGEVAWLEPYPDALVDAAPSADAMVSQRESLSLAFVTALQLLPPRQLAVLILRDVVGFAASEVASMLDTTVESANGSLKRARASMDRARAGLERCPPEPGSVRERSIVARFISAWESADLERLVEVLTDDVFMSMPPIPLEYIGRAAVSAFCARLFDAGRRFTLLATRANGQPAFGAYLNGSEADRPGVGLYVLGLDGDRIATLCRFERHLLPAFGLPPSLDLRTPGIAPLRSDDRARSGTPRWSRTGR